MEFRDLKAQYKKYENEIDKAIKRVLLNTRFIGGLEVARLEDRLAKYVGVKHCISCANGTDAMLLTLTAWNIKEGDAVFIPDFTFFATAEVVALRGATPIIIDVDEKTFNMDFIDLEIKIQKVLSEGKLSPKVILPVDLFGLPANYVEIEKIAKNYNLKILEDGAQGFGGSINGKKACSFGDAATTSFFPAKPLGCYGDGGAIFTNNDDLAKTLNSLKIHGKGDNKYDNVRIGFNSRLDTMQAAILNIKLDAFISHELSDVNNIFGLYDSYLKGIVETPEIPNGYISSFAQYTIKLRNVHERDSLQKRLGKEGIPSMIYYSKPIHSQLALVDYKYDDKEFEITNDLCNRVLSLPIHPYLNKDDIVTVTNVIREWVESKL
ncbi:DegT/DnrJ/EryC1/StrS family aminotransferase [Candidatus Izimaplasma bacterium]|nr:DegT/DnrJ/EryC1/StrS family aminotransferase [Candidatus Izimaplasma bacterium]